MGDESRDYRGGDVELSADRPRGLPFLKPLYAPPPYQYTGDVVLMVVYEAEESAIREVLPRAVRPLPLHEHRREPRVLPRGPGLARRPGPDGGRGSGRPRARPRHARR